MLFKRLVIGIGMLTLILGASAALAGFGPRHCPEKSLFVNISSERVRAVQVGLMVAMANAGGEELAALGGAGQGAAIQLFFADAAAPYVLDLEQLEADGKLAALDTYLRDEFGYGIEDVARLQTQQPVTDQLPGILFLQQGYDAQVYACTLCVMETLGAIGVVFDPDDPATLMPYLIDGTVLMTPDQFSVIYDRKQRGCDTAATVISY